jgi:hypothetical protein
MLRAQNTFVIPPRTTTNISDNCRISANGKRAARLTRQRPFLGCRAARMSAFGGKADIAIGGQHVR